MLTDDKEIKESNEVEEVVAKKVRQHQIEVMHFSKVPDSTKQVLAISLEGVVGCFMLNKFVLRSNLQEAFQ